MAGIERNVSLVISAKDKTEKAVQSAAEALEHLRQAQESVGKSSEASGKSFDRLKSAVGNLEAELVALKAFSKVTDQLDRSRDAVEDLDRQIDISTRDLQEMSQKLADATQKTRQKEAAVHDAKRSYEQLKQAVDAAVKATSRDSEAATEARKVREKARKELTEVNAAYREAEREQRRLTNQVERFSDVLAENKTSVEKAREELKSIEQTAHDTSVALGGVHASQAEISKASKDATLNLERMRKAMQSIATSEKQTVSSNPVFAQIDQVRKTKKAWQEATDSVRDLAAQMKQTDKPTLAMSNAMDLAKASAKAAKLEYLAQAEALRKLRSEQRSVSASSERSSSSGSLPHSKAMRSSTTEALKLRDAFKSLYGESRKSMSLFQRLRGEILSMTIAYVGLYSATNQLKSIIDTAIAYQATYRRLEVVFGDNRAAIQNEMSYLESEANRLGVVFTTLAKSYGGFSVAAQDANFSLEERRKLFKAVSESGVVLNATTEDMAGIFKALEQIMSKGKVQAEELRGQLGDRMTGAFKIFADALGVTTAELDELLKKGGVLADRSNLLAFADRLNEKYGPALQGSIRDTRAEMGRFENTLIGIQRTIGESGFIEGFTSALREFNEQLNSEGSRDFFESLGIVLGKIAAMLPVLVENFEHIARIFQLFVAVKLSQMFIGLIGVMSNLTTDVRGGTIAWRAYRLSLLQASRGNGIFAATAGVMRNMLIANQTAAIGLISAFRSLYFAMGGWPGIVITGLTTLATFILPSMAAKSLDAEKATLKFERAIREVSDAYVEAEGNAKKWADQIQRITAFEIQQDIEQAAEDARNSLADIPNMLQMTLGFEFITKETETALKQLVDLKDALRSGQIGVEEYRKAVSEVGSNQGSFFSAADEETFNRLIQKSLDAADSYAQAQDRVEKYEAMLKVVTGTADETTVEILGLSDAFADQGDNTGSVAKATKNIEDYVKAMRELGKQIPEMKKAISLEESLAKNRETYRSGVEAIGGTKLPERLYEPENYRELFASFSGDQPGQDGYQIEELYQRFLAANKAVRDEYEKVEKTSKKTRDAQAEFNKSLQKTIEAREFEISQITRTAREQAILSALFDAEQDAKFQGVKLSAKQRDDIKRTAAAQFDANRALEIEGEIRQANLELVELKNGGLTEEQYLMSTLGVDRLDNLTKEEESLKNILALIYNIRKAESDRNKVEQELSKNLQALEGQYNSQLQLMEYAQEAGDVSMLAQLRLQLETITQKYLEALKAKREYLSAFDTEEARNEIKSIDLAIARLTTFKTELLITSREIFERFSDTVANAFDQVVQAFIDGENAWTSFRDAILVGVADILRDIAKLIIKTQILKLLLKSPLGKFIDGALEGAGLSKAADELLVAAGAIGLAADKLSSAAKDAQGVGGLGGPSDASVLRQEGKTSSETAKQGGWFGEIKTQIASFFGNFWTTLQDIFSKLIGFFKGLFGSLSGMLGGGGGIGGILKMATSFIPGIPFFHTGGIIGQTANRRSDVVASAFANAKRYHDGGIVGLRSDERAIIGQVGEGVFTPEQMSNVAKGLAGAGKTPVVQLKNVNVIDPVEVLKHALADSAGQSVLLNHMRDNSRSFNGVLSK